MSFRWLVVPALRPGQVTEQLNDFWAEVHVLSVRRGVIRDGVAFFWPAWGRPDCTDKTLPGCSEVFYDGSRRDVD